MRHHPRMCIQSMNHGTLCDENSPIPTPLGRSGETSQKQSPATGKLGLHARKSTQSDADKFKQQQTHAPLGSQSR